MPVKSVQIGSISVGDGLRPLLIAGPCVIESETLCIDIARRVRDIAARAGVPYVFKASFDKANRTSVDSFRGPGIERGLDILARVKESADVPVLTDIHDPGQARRAAEVVDVLQIPAFLCRQTDLLVAAGETGRTVNIKKGQFLDPQAMRHAVEKVRSTGNERVMLCERGTTFGYGDLVSDMRSIVWMRALGCPVIYDATHSIQRPGGLGSKSGGTPELALPLALAAVAAGADGLFIETHPEPAKALSDAASMLPLDALETLLRKAVAVFEAARR